jgi:hypothetical protein
MSGRATSRRATSYAAVRPRPRTFPQFRQRYTDELRPHAEHIAELRRRARSGTLTILYAARDREHSNAAVLAPIVCRGFPQQLSSGRMIAATTLADSYRQDESQARLEPMPAQLASLSRWLPGRLARHAFLPLTVPGRRRLSLPEGDREGRPSGCGGESGCGPAGTAALELQRCVERPRPGAALG